MYRVDWRFEGFVGCNACTRLRLEEVEGAADEASKMEEVD